VKDPYTTTVAILVAVGTLALAVADLLQGQPVDYDRVVTVVIAALTAVGFWRARDAEPTASTRRKAPPRFP